jgi:hypothetical protein
VGTGTEHEGFRIAANDVTAALEEHFFKSDGYTPSTRKVFICGHSRGAAVANLVAGDLSNSNYSYIDRSGVFAYTFACPRVSTNVATYSNIYNFNYSGDLIAQVPLESWNYGCYGKSINLGSNDNTNVRFKEVTGKSFGGEDDITQYVRTLDTIDSPASLKNAKLVTDIIAFGVGERPIEELVPILESNGIKEANKIFILAVKHSADPNSGIVKYCMEMPNRTAAYRNTFNELVRVRNQVTAEDFTEDDWYQWKKDNKEFIDQFTMRNKAFVHGKKSFLCFLAL